MVHKVPQFFYERHLVMVKIQKLKGSRLVVIDGLHPFRSCTTVL
jgi:uridine kinase